MTSLRYSIIALIFIANACDNSTEKKFCTHGGEYLYRDNLNGGIVKFIAGPIGDKMTVMTLDSSGKEINRQTIEGPVRRNGQAFFINNLINMPSDYAYNREWGNICSSHKLSGSVKSQYEVTCQRNGGLNVVRAVLDEERGVISIELRCKDCNKTQNLYLLSYVGLAQKCE